LDSTDQFLKFNWLRTGEKAKFRFRGDYSEQTIRRAERSDTDLDVEDLIEIPIDDSGVVFSNQDRQRIQLMPEFTSRITQKSQIGARLQYLDTSYDTGTGAGLNDFNETRATLSYEYTLNPRDALILSAGATRYEPDAGTTDINSYGAGIGFRRSLSERTTVSVNLGAEQTETGDNSDANNVVGDISVNHRLETTRILAAYRRSVSGSGFGNVSVRDSIVLNLKRNLSEKSTIGIGIRAYQRSALDSGNQNFVEQDYLQLRAQYSWQLTRIFSIDFDYRFTDLDRGDQIGSEDSNQFGLWFRYRPIQP
jgi:outer membrane protein assembly factor BamA